MALGTRTDTPTFPPGGSEPTLLPVHPRPRPSAHGLTPAPHPPYLFTDITDSWCYWDWEQAFHRPLASIPAVPGRTSASDPAPSPCPRRPRVEQLPQAPDLLWVQPRSLTPGVKSSGSAFVLGGDGEVARCLPARSVGNLEYRGLGGCCRFPHGHCPPQCPPLWLVSMEKDTGSSDGEPGPPSSLP